MRRFGDLEGDGLDACDYLGWVEHALVDDGAGFSVEEVERGLLGFGEKGLVFGRGSPVVLVFWEPEWRGCGCAENIGL